MPKVHRLPIFSDDVVVHPCTTSDENNLISSLVKNREFAETPDCDLPDRSRNLTEGTKCRHLKNQVRYSTSAISLLSPRRFHHWCWSQGYLPAHSLNPPTSAEFWRMINKLDLAASELNHLPHVQVLYGTLSFNLKHHAVVAEASIIRPLISPWHVLQRLDHSCFSVF